MGHPRFSKKDVLAARRRVLELRYVGGAADKAVNSAEARINRDVGSDSLAARDDKQLFNQAAI
jgi:hypothetical protein